MNAVEYYRLELGRTQMAIDWISHSAAKFPQYMTQEQMIEWLRQLSINIEKCFDEEAGL